MSDKTINLTTPHFLLEERDAKIEILERENQRLRDRLAKAEAVCKPASRLRDKWRSRRELQTASDIADMFSALDEWRKAKGEGARND